MKNFLLVARDGLCPLGMHPLPDAALERLRGIVAEIKAVAVHNAVQ